MGDYLIRRLLALRNRLLLPLVLLVLVLSYLEQCLSIL